MKTLVITLLLAGTLAGPLAGSLTGQQAQAPVFRSGADVVEVDAIVRDKNGRFVEELTPEDFEVREEGRPEAIDLFYLVGAPPAAAASAPAAPSAATPASPIVQAPPRSPRVFVVAFDDDHLTAGGFRRVQTAALALFSKHFQPGDIGGVLAGGRMINGRLTSDREELLNAVRAVKPSFKKVSRKFDEQMWPRMSEIEAARIQWQNDETVRSEVIRRACADDPTLCINADVAVRGKAADLAGETQATSNLTIQALSGLFNGLARIEGRKTVLLMSEGFIAEESWPLVRQAVGLAARANARLYTIDARGLDTHGMDDHLSGIDPGGSDAVSRMLNQLDEGADAMNSLAVDTGGFVVRNTNILDAAVGRIFDDASRYYVLGYRPTAAPDGRFRKISVRVKRPGVSVRARSGYVATPRAAAATTEARGSTGSPRADAPGSTNAHAVGLESARRARVDERARRVSGGASRIAARGPGRTGGERRARSERGGRAAESWRRASHPSGRVQTRRGAGREHGRRGRIRRMDGVSARRRRVGAHGARRRGRAARCASVGPLCARPVRVRAARLSRAPSRRGSACASSTPEFEPVYFDLVDGYIQTRDSDKAIGVLRAAKSRWPKEAEVDNALGVIQAARGALDDAAKSFAAAVAVAPQDAIGYFNLAKTLEIRYRRDVQRARAAKRTASTSDRDKAIESYKRYLAIGGPLADSAREGLVRLGWQ